MLLLAYHESHQVFRLLFGPRRREEIDSGNSALTYRAAIHGARPLAP